MLVAFDFDGTITDRDSLQDFIRRMRGWPVCFRAYLACVPRVLVWDRGPQRRQAIKHRFLRSALGGLSREQVQVLADTYVRDYVPQIVRPEMMERVRAVLITGVVPAIGFYSDASELVPAHLDVASFARYLAFEEVVDNFDDIDGPGNNAFLRYDATTGGFTVVAWDHNLAFGASPGGAGGGGARAARRQRSAPTQARASCAEARAGSPTTPPPSPAPAT